MAEIDKTNEILNYYGLKTNIEDSKKWTKQYVDGEISKIPTGSTLEAGTNITILDNVISSEQISDVDELPDASENRNRIFRRNSDKDVFVAKRISSTVLPPTNKLPDNEQIDKAYIWIEGDEPFYYKGAWKLILDDGEINGYGWLETHPDSDEWYLAFAQDDAVITTEETKCYDFSFDEVNDFDLENHTVTMEADVADYNWEYADTFYGSNIVTATYNAPESAQIGNAYLIDGAETYTGVYDGTQVTFIDTDGSGEEVTGYKWAVDGESGYIATSKPASEIYFYYDVDSTEYYTDTTVWFVFEDNTSERSSILFGEDDSIYIPQLNASDEKQIGHAQIEINDTPYTYIGQGVYIDNNDERKTLYGWKNSGDYYFCSEIPAEDIYEGQYGALIGVRNLNDYVTDNGDGTFTFDDVWAETRLYEDSFVLHDFIPYQRVDTVEEWDWQSILRSSGGEGVAQESTSQEILAQLNTLVNAHVINGNSSFYDGMVFEDGYEPANALYFLKEVSQKLKAIDDSALDPDKKLTLITANDFIVNLLGNSTFNCQVERINLTAVKEITSISRLFSSLPKLTSLECPELEIFYGRYLGDGCTYLYELNWPKLRENRGGVCHNSEIRTIRFPMLEVNTGSIGQNSKYLIDFETGAHFTTNMSFSAWSPTEALRTDTSSLVDPGETFTSNREKLLYNLREHMAANLPDRTGDTQLTITFSAAMLSAIQNDTPTLASFTNKNWLPQ